ncbi:MAG: hypothetical protein IIT37_11720, partial [Bacteroidales bacterium]|nr:hypothetical protein [Bacteroidales bacterium]
MKTFELTGTKREDLGTKFANDQKGLASPFWNSPGMPFSSLLQCRAKESLCLVRRNRELSMS